MSIAVITICPPVRPSGRADVAINIRTIGRNVIRGRHLNNQIRLAEHPARDELWRCGRYSDGFPSGIPCFTHLPLNQGDLAVLETPLVPERIRRFFRLPGRHEARLCHRCDDAAALRTS